MKKIVRRALGVIASGALASTALGAELIVPSETYPDPGTAVALAANGDTVTLLASGSPYVVSPPPRIAGKAITLRGSTGDPSDVVIRGPFNNNALEIQSGAGGTVVKDLTFELGPTPINPVVFASGAGLVTIENCLFRGDPGISGGTVGVYASVTTLHIFDTRFEDLIASGPEADGIAVSVFVGDLIAKNCQFINNRIHPSLTPSNGAFGGAVYVLGGDAQLTRCHFESNRGGWGGGVAVNNGSATIDACSFVNNEAHHGPGVYAGDAAFAVIRNSLFAKNHSTTNDGAIFTNTGAFIANSTFADNVADNSYIIGGSPPPGSVTIDNSIIWGNSMNTNIIPAPMMAVMHNNIIQQAYTGGAGSFDNQIVDPMFVDALGGDYRLAPGSPAIDAGNTSLGLGSYVDFDGNPRAADDPNTTDTGLSYDGPVIDVGCFEVQPPACPIDTNGDNMIDLDDLQNLLFSFGASCP
ncbi:MAG: right-handed parallel beta-helix repeat-containing protein [Phycisphaerales bacterium]|nr:right-handed parallel beta-helix repeat-containing protein [Phycisphaerales bacterium]